MKKCQRLFLMIINKYIDPIGIFFCAEEFSIKIDYV